MTLRFFYNSNRLFSISIIPERTVGYSYAGGGHLEEKGVAAERPAMSGFGQSKPVADNTAEKGGAENRRATLVKL